MPSPRTICLPIGSIAAAVIVTGPVATSWRSAQFRQLPSWSSTTSGCGAAVDVRRAEVRDDLVLRVVVLEVEARAVPLGEVLEEAPVGRALHQQLAVLVVEDRGVVDLHGDLVARQHLRDDVAVLHVRPGDDALLGVEQHRRVHAEHLEVGVRRDRLEVRADVRDRALEHALRQPARRLELEAEHDARLEQVVVERPELAVRPLDEREAQREHGRVAVALAHLGAHELREHLRLQRRAGDDDVDARRGHLLVGRDRHGLAGDEDVEGVEPARRVADAPEARRVAIEAPREQVEAVGVGGRELEHARRRSASRAGRAAGGSRRARRRP